MPRVTAVGPQVRAAVTLRDAEYRANPGYDLVRLDKAIPSELRLLDGSDGEALYGVLRPRPGSPELAVRVAAPDTALLFLGLAEPGALPAYVRSQLKDDLEPTIGRLLLDGVLQIARDGNFVSGPATVELLSESAPAGGRGRIGELSVAALQYGGRLGDALPLEVIAARLYLFGCRPISPRLRAQFGDPGALWAYLGSRRPTGPHPPLTSGWREVLAPGWRAWNRRRPGNDDGKRFKLYVSPAVTALPHAFGVVAETLDREPGVLGLKVGRDIFGVSRPDKIVAYFARLEDLQRCGAQLRETLAGCPAHGVPFTAAVTEDGLLSWGADPSPSASAAGARSWRQWLAQRMAELLVDGQRAEVAGVPAWRYVLHRLRLSGVDTDTWIPSGTLWDELMTAG